MAQISVAVVGASNDRRKNGNKAVRTYLANDYKVYPVNPREESIEGLKSYATVEMIPDPVEIVSMYVPPAVGMKLLPGIAEKKPNQVWLNPGSESDDLIEAAADLKLRTIVACSMDALGVDPESVPET
jgi:predicted CoA-binding protein